MFVGELIRNSYFDVNCDVKVYKGYNSDDEELIYNEYDVYDTVGDYLSVDVMNMEITYITTDESGLIIEVE